MSFRAFRSFLPLVVLVGTAVCDNAPVSPVPEVVTLEIQDCPVRFRGLGGSARCSAVARDRDGNLLDVSPTWTSSEPSRVEVDAAGVVTAKGWGSARIVAMADTASAEHEVRVVFLTRPRDAEEAAVYLSGELWPPEALADQVFEDLERIRQDFGDEHPVVDRLRFTPPWKINEIKLQFTEEGAQKFQAGEYDAWDSLNAEFGVERIEPTASFPRRPWVVIEFGPVLHIDQVVEFYDELPDVVVAERNGFVFDGSRIYPRELESGRTYLFRSAHLYCQVGRCAVNEYWYFEVCEGEASLRGIYKPEEDSVAPAWWGEARENQTMWEGEASDPISGSRRPPAP